MSITQNYVMAIFHSNSIFERFGFDRIVNNEPSFRGYTIRAFDVGSSTAMSAPSSARPTEEYDTLLPFICDGLNCGERAFHVLPAN
jgi:hypothetical protein